MMISLKKKYKTIKFFLNLVVDDELFVATYKIIIFKKFVLKRKLIQNDMLPKLKWVSVNGIIYVPT